MNTQRKIKVTNNRNAEIIRMSLWLLFASAIVATTAFKMQIATTLLHIAGLQVAFNFVWKRSKVLGCIFVVIYTLAMLVLIARLFFFVSLNIIF